MILQGGKNRVSDRTAAVLLRDLTIENYRSFDKYRLDNLARVNLLVGKNNCGKTSVLEAGLLMAARGSIEAVLRICEERGEILGFRRVVGRGVRDIGMLAGNLFNGRVRGKGDVVEASIACNSLGEVILQHGRARELESSSPGLFARPEDMPGVSRKREFDRYFLAITYSDTPLTPISTTYNSDPNGIVTVDRYDRMATGSWIQLPIRDVPPVCLLSAGGIHPETLKDDWNRLVRAGSESRAEEALRLLLPDLRRIIFLPDSDTPEKSKLSVLVDTHERRLALAEMGEGTNRLLALGIGLGGSEGGTLFVDEIDTGLHYSVLPQMWEMLIKAADELDVQVFATTHSLDCIRGLAEAVRNDERYADDVAIFKIDRRGDHAARYAGDELEVIVEQEIEVR